MERFADEKNLYRSKLALLFDQFAKLGNLKGIEYKGRITEAVVTSMNKQATIVDTAMVAWKDSQKQSFFVITDLQHLLDQTDVGNVPADAVRLPYPAIWIEPIPDFFEHTAVKFNGKVTEKKPAGLLLVEEEIAGPLVVDGKRVFQKGDNRFVLLDEAQSKALAETSETREDDPPRRQLWIFELYEQMRDGSFPYIRHCLWLDKPLMSECIENAVRDMRIKDEIAYHRPPDPADDAATMRTIAYVTNLLLYLSSPDPDIRVAVPPTYRRRGKQSPERYQRELEEHEKRDGRAHVVGLAITEIRRMVSEGGDTISADDREKTGLVRRKHWVRGTWRWQRVGFGRSQVRYTWVRPHFRCKGEPGIEERTYLARLGP